MEAADYQKTVVAPEGTTEVEAQRMKLLRQRQSLSKILWMPSTNLWQTPETCLTLTQALHQEIRIEAATLSEARNDATRKAAKAKEVADLVAIK